MGLEAQREHVRAYLAQCSGELAEEFIEVESGTAKDRPILVKSIARCRQLRATLVIAKLDRLARSVAFISSLMESGTEFVAVDVPFANKLMLHLMAAFAEHERGEISARTRAALAAAKARGVVLGSNGNVLATRHKEEAQRYAEKFRGQVSEILSNGVLTVRDVATELNKCGLRTRQNTLWGPSTTSRLLSRLGAQKSGL
ncbi:DNA invertase Pin-like site-specific DNA recombinase [Polymorphobacter multimanifer]|uniref:DNA invertase Pin-like site-specific DNA recombinase n=1 Tax=Polymorphobacter multimanifer TaxID=1070431 RepID=A0A841LB03_9SPHN|nr:DNA invertase Pin-like site-specific DNA recombinase [Polymorphobacter multimanifer]